MSLLYVSKRRPQGRDLLARPYGRFFYLPWIVAERLGEDSYLVLFDYHSERVESRAIDGLSVISIGLRTDPFVVFRRLLRIVDDIRPRWVVGFSDIWFGILADYLARRYGAQCLIDAYDNYEAYLPMAKPIHWIWRRALARADAVTAAGPQLLERLCAGRGPHNSAVVPMAADPYFKPMDKVQCRDQLGLPREKRLIGNCGAARHSRGIGVFEKAIANLMRKVDDVNLVCTGLDSSRFERFGSRVHNLGYLDDADMPLVINACDVLVAMNRDSAFGNYSYPAKIYEAIACGRPVVASATNSVRWILREGVGRSCNVEDIADLERALNDALDYEAPLIREFTTWEGSAAIFASMLETSG